MTAILGLLGGMGPATTLEFLTRLQAFTPVESQADHIRVLMDLNPEAPGLGIDTMAAEAELAEMAQGLAGAGADVLAIASNGAHVHAQIIQEATDLPLVDMIECAAAEAEDTGAQRIGVLGSKPALRLYHEHLAARGLSAIFLPPERQAAYKALIAQVQAGDTGEAARAAMKALAQDLIAAGARTVIAGGTDVPHVLGPDDLDVPLIDGLEALARKCVAVCKGWERV